MKTTVASYILDFLADQGIEHVFGITGGAIAFVIDSFHKRKDIKYVPVAHEQAAAMAADAYARVHKSGLGATMVTSGPGATNLLTGIACSYFDSIPTLHFSGQVNTFDQGQKIGIRQIGFQETNIVDMARPVTKFTYMIEDAKEIRYWLEYAVWVAKEGRPGPVLLDIPQNLQREEIDPSKLKGFIAPKEKKTNITKKVKQMYKLINKAKKPLVLVGGGVKIANAEKLMEMFIYDNTLPFVTSWSAIDMFDGDDAYRIGNIGVYGNRGANFALQDCDLLISIGSRLDTRQIGSKPEEFAPKAKKVVVDIDYDELHKGRGMRVDLPINADCMDFLEACDDVYNETQVHDDWLDKCNEWSKSFPMVDKGYHSQKDSVNAYVFNEVLSEELAEDAIIIPDDGGNLVWAMQAWKVKEGQKIFSALGNSPMGYSFPAAIGAAIATKKPVICIDGDGSFQINIQELQTMVHNKLPIKIFIMNNNGYGIIKQFQKTWLGGRFEATGKSSGVTAPDFIKVAKAYGVKTFTIKSHSELRKKIRAALDYDGAVLVDVKIEEFQPLIPKLDYGDTLDNMSPKL